MNKNKYYVISDDLSILSESESIQKVLNEWINKEIENIKDNMEDNDIQAKETIKELQNFKIADNDILKQFNNICDILKNWEDVKIAYGVQLKILDKGMI